MSIIEYNFSNEGLTQKTVILKTKLNIQGFCTII